MPTDLSTVLPSFSAGVPQAASRIRPEFQHAGRLEIIVPSDPSTSGESHLGGEPVLPGDVPWPEIDGAPLIFLAQIDCNELPGSLWGGKGPRTGLLQVFVTNAIVGEHRGPLCRVLHVDGSGTRRSVTVPDAFAEESYWIRQEFRDSFPKTSAPFPRCPVRLYEVDEVMDGNRTNQGRNAPVPDAAPWGVREDMYPVTLVLFEDLLGRLRLIYDDTCARYRGMWKRLYTDIRAHRAKPEEERTEQETKQHALNTDAIEDLRNAAGKLAADRAAFHKTCASLVTPKEGDLVDGADWQTAVEGLEEARITLFEWEVVRPQYGPEQVLTFDYHPTFDSKPATYGDYDRELRRIIKALTDLIEGRKRLQPSLERLITVQREMLDNMAEDPGEDPEVQSYLEAKETILRANLEALEQAQTFLPDDVHRAKALQREIGGAEVHQQAISDAAWDALKLKLEGLVTATIRKEFAPSRIPALNALRFVEKPVLDGKDHRLRDWKGRQRAELMRVYSKAPDRLPDWARARQEHLTLVAAAQRHDGIGGIPRWDWVHYDAVEPYLPLAGSVDALPAPGSDNAVLLQLFSRDVPGWMFGDLSHIVFLIPLEDLEAGDFSRVRSVVAG